MDRWGRFLLIVALICGGTYAALLIFARTPAYCAHSGGYADTAPCYKYDVRGVKADALLVGDSSLLYAIKPALVQQQSGISSYNYGMVGAAFSFDPAAVIDHYLATNARPRVIIVYLAPWTKVLPGTMTDPQWFPIALLTLQHGGPRDLFRLIAARPTALAEIPPIVVQSTQLPTSPALLRRSAMEQAQGYFRYASGKKTVAEECHPLPPIDPAMDARRRAVLAQLRDRYARRGIPLYIYVAPSAACDRAIGLTRRAYAGIADNLPQPLPDRYFASDGSEPRHVHVNDAGVPVASALFARFLTAKMGGATPR